MKKVVKAIPNRRLREERELRGWSQKYVADQIDVERYYISRWERGSTFPSSRYRQRLCNLFDKNVRELGLLQKDIVDNSDQPVHPVSHDQEPIAVTPVSSKPIWNVPYRRNPFFTGRENVLKCLHSRLHSGKMAALTQIQAISGLGGVGKTQTAVEYAYCYRDNYQAVLWAKADTHELLISDLAAMADLLHLPEKNERDQRRVVEAVKSWLNEHADWLLILDNVEDLFMASNFFPSSCAGHILLTTRAQVTGTLAQRINLEKMELEEGALFLLRRSKLLAPDALLENASVAYRTNAGEIVQVLDGLPLALDQAGAYIEETVCSLSDYLGHYRARRAILLNLRGTYIVDHPDSVTATFSLSIEKVEQANSTAADLLRFCAFLHPDAIPEEIFTAGIHELGPLLQPVAADAFALDIAIKELRKFSLLHRHPDAKTLTIHSLVQAVLKDGMDEEIQRQWAQRTVQAVNCAFPESEFAMWSRCQRYLPHAQVCATLVEQWKMISKEAGQLLNKAGVYLREHAQYAQAELLFGKALTIREQALGPEHPEVASSLNDLAFLYCDQGKYVQAEPLYQLALHIREQALGPEHPEVAVSLNNLARHYYKQGKYVQAEPLYQRALVISEKSLGQEHPTVAIRLNNLALLYYAQGKYVQAEALFQQALEIHVQSVGPEHPRTAQSLNDLARLYSTQGKHVQAEPLYQRALAIRERALGPGHLDVAESLNGLACLYRDQNKLMQAESLFEQALAIRELAVGSEHPDVAESLNDLANLYSTQSDYVQAEPLYQRALAIWGKGLGQDHPTVAACLESYADLLRKIEQKGKAATYKARARQIRTKLVQELPTLSEGSEGATENSYKDEDPLKIFFIECCELHPRAWSRACDLWTAYQDWAIKNGERFPLQRRAFTIHLKAKGCMPDRTKSSRIWRGITLLDLRSMG